MAVVVVEETERWETVEWVEREAPRLIRRQPKPQPVISSYRPGRNQPCPCGSGKKYKKCCGVKR